MPAHVDSLLLYTTHRMRINIPTSDTAQWVSALNSVITDFCVSFDALPKMDTVTMGRDSAAYALNSDFLRPSAVFKIIGDSIRIPMGQIGTDTFYLQIGDTSKMDQKSITAPKLYFVFGSNDSALIFTQPKYVLDTFHQDFEIHYWARDAWLRPGTPDSLIGIMSRFRPRVVELTAEQIFKDRGGRPGN